MPKIPSKDELGIPWEVVGNDFIVSGTRTIGVCKTREDADFIIHAANSYHALIEALEFALKNIKVNPSCRDYEGCDTYRQLKNCRHCERYKIHTTEIDKAKALLAHHAPQEAKNE